jgi:hypothetical protein
MNGTYFMIFLAAVSLPVTYLLAIHCWLGPESQKVEGHDGQV